MSKLKIHTVITLGILFVVSAAAVANASLIDYLNGGYDTESANSEPDGSGGGSFLMSYQPHEYLDVSFQGTPANYQEWTQCWNDSCSDGINYWAADVTGGSITMLVNGELGYHEGVGSLGQGKLSGSGSFGRLGYSWVNDMAISFSGVLWDTGWVTQGTGSFERGQSDYGWGKGSISLSTVPTPEPGTLLLAGAGAIGAILRRLKR
jgi:hypothetical protein